MTLEERYQLGSDPVWRARCQTAILQSSTDVMAEDPATVGHAERLAFANKVLLNPSLQSAAVSFGIASQPGITAEATDSDIQFTCNAMFNAWAGVPVEAP